MSLSRLCASMPIRSKIVLRLGLARRASIPGITSCPPLVATRSGINQGRGGSSLSASAPKFAPQRLVPDHHSWFEKQTGAIEISSQIRIRCKQFEGP
jgi:hypothetical protein